MFVIESPVLPPPFTYQKRTKKIAQSGSTISILVNLIDKIS